VDPGDATQVIITGNAGRSISRLDVRPLKSGERDQVASAVTPPETAGDAVVLGFDLEGVGSQTGSVTVDIGGLLFTVATSLGQSAGSVLFDLEAAIDPDPVYEASIVGTELLISGSVLGNDYSVFVTDAEPGTLGFSYGFSVEAVVPEPSTWALLAAAALGGWAMRTRRRPLLARISPPA
jgi:hypothetical protein